LIVRGQPLAPAASLAPPAMAGIDWRLAETEFRPYIRAVPLLSI